jgi:hypothetical protein
MLNRIQISETKNKMIKVPTSNVTPLTGPAVKENRNDSLKDLRRPRSGRYIQNLIELRGLLLELDMVRREQTIIGSDRYDHHKKEQGERRTAEDANNSPYDNGNPIYEDDQRLSDSRQEENELNTGETIGTHEENELNPDEVLSIHKECRYDVAEAIWDKPKEMSVNHDRGMSQQIQDKQEQTFNPIIDDLEKRIQEKLEQLGKENSRISEMLTFIYRSDVEEYLIECGVISRPGTPVYCREDMAIGVEDPKLANQLKRGYDLYFDYADRPDFLTLEIYIDAYCVIYRDGIVKTIV